MTLRLPRVRGWFIWVGGVATWVLLSSTAHAGLCGKATLSASVGTAPLTVRFRATAVEGCDRNKDKQFWLLDGVNQGNSLDWQRSFAAGEYSWDFCSWLPGCEQCCDGGTIRVSAPLSTPTVTETPGVTPTPTVPNCGASIQPPSGAAPVLVTGSIAQWPDPTANFLRWYFGPGVPSDPLLGCRELLTCTWTAHCPGTYNWAARAYAGINNPPVCASSGVFQAAAACSLDCLAAVAPASGPPNFVRGQVRAVALPPTDKCFGGEADQCGYRLFYEIEWGDGRRGEWAPGTLGTLVDIEHEYDNAQPYGWRFRAEYKKSLDDIHPIATCERSGTLFGGATATPTTTPTATITGTVPATATATPTVTATRTATLPVDYPDTAVKSSPPPAPTADDRTFVVGPAMLPAATCLYAAGGPIEIEIPVTRAVGEVLPNGTLSDLAALIANQVVGPTAQLSLVAYDVDSSAVVAPPLAPESDPVFFNGEFLGFLTGSDDAWTRRDFQIPIDKLRFPAPAGVGGMPLGAANTLRIEIDTQNTQPTWCTTVGWASLRIQAMSPVLLIHGNNSDPGFWTRQGFTTALDDRRIPYDSSIQLPTQLIAPNADLLNQQIPPRVRRFGADSVHLITHSKGGLDAGAFLASYGRNLGLQVLSLSTLSTPHLGSVGHDLLYAATYTWGRIEGVGEDVQGLAVILEPNAATLDLTTQGATDFTTRNNPFLPRAIDYRAAGADADLNVNGQIDFVPDEYAGDRSEQRALRALHSVAVEASRQQVDRVYQLLRSRAAVRVVRRSILGGLTTYRVGVAILGGGPNDTAVTIESAEGMVPFAALPPLSGANGRDHATVANGASAAMLLPYLYQTEAAIGDFR